MKGYAIGLGLLVTLGALTPAIASPIVADGDFSNTFPSFNTYSAGQALQSGDWTVINGTVLERSGGGSVDEIGGYWQAPTSPGGSVDLDGNAPGGIQQTVSLAAGNYVLSFYLSGNPDGDNASPKLVTAAVGSTSNEYSYDTFTSGNNHTDMGYELETLSFTILSGGDYNLSFASDDAANSPYGPVIGGVSINPVPEPITLSLFGAGLAGAVAMRRRKKAAKA